MVPDYILLRFDLYQKQNKASDFSKALLLVVGLTRKFSNHIADDFKLIELIYNITRKNLCINYK